MMEIEKKKLYELKAKSKAINPLVRIGKNGIGENSLKQIVMLLKSRKLVKIKILKSALTNSSMDELIENIVKECDCVVVDRIGLTFSIYR
jgi:RNA-binding protein